MRPIIVNFTAKTNKCFKLWPAGDEGSLGGVNADEFEQSTR